MTITTLRPNGSAGGSQYMNVTGTTSYVTALSDNSDSTYVQSTTDKASGKPTFPTSSSGGVSLAANQRIKSCNIRIRNAHSTSVDYRTQNTITAIYDYRNTALSGVGVYQSARGSQTIATSTGPLAYAAPGGRAWTQDILDHIMVSVQWIKNGATDFQRVHEIYLDVDVNTQPTVSGTPTVTNYTNNATPTVTWTYNDVDGDVQSAWQVKIFDSTTVGGSNFSADSSTAAWDSGVQAGSASSTVSSTALKNGVIYYAYVRVAHDWPGPEGRYWWSSWVASSSFAVSFTSPAQPAWAVGSVQTTDLSQYRCVLGIDAPINLLLSDNASFETSLGNWVADTNCSVSRVTSQFADGIASMQMSSTAAGDMIARCNLDVVNDPRVNVGTTYTALASFKSAAVTGRTAAVGVQWIDGNNTIISTQYGTPVTDTTGGWTQAVFSGVAPAGAAEAKPMVKVISTAGASELHFVDKVDVHAGTSTTWSPGGYNNNQGSIIIQRLEKLTDDRGPALNWCHPQVASGGSFNRNAGYGFSWDTTKESLLWMWLDKTLPGKNNPPGMIRWTPYAQVGNLYPGWWPYPGAELFTCPAVPSTVHVFSCYLWTDSGSSTSLDVAIEWLSGTSSVLSSSTVTATVTNTPQQIVVTGTAPIGVARARFRITNNNSVNDRHIFFTKAGFGLGTTPVDDAPSSSAVTNPVATSEDGAGLWKTIRYVGFDLNGNSANPNDPFTANFPAGFTTGQREIINDFEYPAGRPVLYRAFISYGTGSNVLTSPTSLPLNIYGAPPAQTVLRSVNDPRLATAVARRKAANFSRSDDAQVFHPLGSDAAPIRVRDWASGEDGTITVITSNEAQFQRLRMMLNRNDVFVIHWAQGGRTYCLLTQRDYQETISSDMDFCDADGNYTYGRIAIHTLAYIETAAP